MSTGKLVVGILGAVAAGAVMGILFAPDSGKNTKKKFLNKSKDLVGEVKGKFENLYKDISNNHEDLLKKSKKFAANVK
ncbi:YtxH domain-containing protein [Flavobacterium sp. WC2509]|uniref:YtxH domain-containing protein n=1 Tax=Flavobacterium sp. WC2509 TaxID=3461406 RepID=UPI004044CBF4